jgi:predicted DNA-binding transcriptional regulator AlpA
MHRHRATLDSPSQQSVVPRSQNGATASAERQAPLSRLERLEAIPLKFLRFSAVRERTGLSRSTIWRLERQGVFPKHRRISANAVGWLEQ